MCLVLIFWNYFFAETIIYTYTDGINFVDIYDVEIICVEIGDIASNITTKNKHIYEIQFRENQTTCPTTTATSTIAQTSTVTSASSVSYIEENKTFLDDPANAATVFTVGGVVIASTFGAGVYLVTKVKCNVQPHNTV